MSARSGCVLLAARDLLARVPACFGTQWLSLTPLLPHARSNGSRPERAARPGPARGPFHPRCVQTARAPSAAALWRGALPHRELVASPSGASSAAAAVSASCRAPRRVSRPIGGHAQRWEALLAAQQRGGTVTRINFRTDTSSTPPLRPPSSLGSQGGGVLSPAALYGEDAQAHGGA
jgi:hypothetical protein